MISTTKLYFSIALLLPIITGVIGNQLYMRPEGKTLGLFTNESFVITCFTTDETIAHLKWLDMDENEITDNTERRIHVQPTAGGENGLELIFTSVQKDDAGTYVCSDTQLTQTVDLIVYKSVSFGNSQRVQFAREHEDAMVTCNVKGDPYPIVQWYYKGHQLKKNSTKYITNDTMLIIREVSRADAGVYQCKGFIVTNLASQVKELDITLEVQYAPEMSEEDTVVYSSFGAEANLTCIANANPDPMFHWRKDGDKIYNSSDHMIINIGKESTLRFKVTDEEQFGAYTCEADNVVGAKEKEIELKEGKAPLPPTLAVSREDQGTLMLELEDADSDSNELLVNGYKVQYIFSSESWDQANTHEFKNGDEFVLRNMSYNSEYLLRAAARNAAGYSDYSEPIKYTTHTFQVAPVVADGNKAVGITLSLMALLLNVFLLWNN